MNPLEQLADIHLPIEVSMWPLAWGWWVSAVIIILLIVGITYAWRHYLINRRAKKAALSALNEINLQQPDAVSQINIVLKRAALSYFPAEQVASLYAQQWSQFLISQLPQKQQQAEHQKIHQFIDSLYQDGLNQNAESGALIAKEWIQKALPAKTKINNSVVEQEIANA